MTPQYKIISTGSKGNAILYHNYILVDCGVPFTLLKPYYKDIKLILLTHIHGDHFNIQTIKKLAFERPSIRFGCPIHLKSSMPPHTNIDIYESNRTYIYNFAAITPVELKHDVPNFGYKIHSYNSKIFHATDTSTLEGIEAKNYDLYAIEHNYDEESTIKKLYEDDEKGKFNYQSRSVLTHMSEQQAKEWLYKNKNENSEVLRLHESSTFL